MTRRQASWILAAIATVAFAGPSFASSRDGLRSLDAESSGRRARRDADWLRQAGTRPAMTPVALVATPAQSLSEQLDSWLGQGGARPERRPEPAAPARTAANPPRR